MADNLPYSTSVGTLENILEKIKTASVPDRVTQDFVSTKLAMKGGSAMSCIPFLKKMGFVASDGAPTELYREFRNPKKARLAVGKAFRKLYERLYEMNEYLHDASDRDILGLIVECTGSEKDSGTTKYTLSTLNMLRRHADFDGPESVDTDDFPINRTPLLQLPTENPGKYTEAGSTPHENGKKISLSYTINLNLPASKDVEVFNAIFKSLKEHILGD